MPQISTVEEPIRDDRIHGQLYYDPEIFDRAVENIWRKEWLFACHDSEMSQPGDQVRARTEVARTVQWEHARVICDDSAREVQLVPVRTPKIVNLNSGRTGWLHALELETLAWLRDERMASVVHPDVIRWTDPKELEFEWRAVAKL